MFWKAAQSRQKRAATAKAPDALSCIVSVSPPESTVKTAIVLDATTTVSLKIIVKKRFN